MSTGAAELPDVFTKNPYPAVVNASLWTLKYELLCYVILAFAAALKLFNKTCMAWLLPVGLFLSCAFLICKFGGQPDPFQPLARFWLCFSLGVTFFVFRNKIKVSWSLGFFLAALLSFSLGTAWDSVLSPLATGYGAVLVGSIPFAGIRELSNREDLSYGVYIYGWPISQTLLFWRPEMTAAQLIFWSCSFSLWVAVLSWRLVEKPSLNSRRRIASAVRTLFMARQSKGSLESPTGVS